ncbi:hypothetical protein [Mycoplasma anserisalpingitidis]|uniref:Uncharacterized protein n=1 Tax=Mycoplasma anserisalpingitidis TaxID=519450 RepID=A0A5B8KBA5_9MOLU|nr:hypothetical protein [Mycoplasma anserisalpingitidis]QDY88337.1 hypothetical protein FOY43_01505 [Mycoplasma anserisalpingitidis]
MKIKTKILLATPLVAVPLVTTLSIVGRKDFVTTKNEIYNAIENYNQVYTLVSNFDEEKGKEILESFRSDSNILDFIYNINQYQNIDDLVDKIYDLKLTKNQMLFLVYKINWYFSSSKNSTTKTGVIIHEKKTKEEGYLSIGFNNGKSGSEKSDTKFKLEDKNGNFIKISGYTHSYSIDNFFAEDVSYIHWSNQYIFNYFFTKILGDQSKSNKFFDDFLDQIVKAEINENELIESANKLASSYVNVEKLEIRLSDLNEKNPAIVLFSSVGKIINSIIKFHNKSRPLYQQPNRIIDIISSLVDDPKNAKLVREKLTEMLNDVDKNVLNRNNTLNLNNYKILWKSAISIYQAYLLADSINLAVKEGYLSSKAAVEILGNALRLASTLMSTTPADPFFMFASGIYDLTVWFLKIIPTGNGYTVYENFNDCGLNDWNFQLKNNADTIYKTALNFSNQLHNGVVWKVTDGWFSYPELYIAKTNEYNSEVNNEPNDSEFQHLTPGTSFNFGNFVEEGFPNKK